MISINDLEWAAGFLEAEGCFHFSTSKHLLMSAGQVQQGALERLQQLFGGSLGQYRDKRPNASAIYRWSAVHARAAGVAMTLYPLLSPKRQTEICKALAQWRTIIPQGYRRQCPQGHPLSGAGKGTVGRARRSSRPNGDKHAKRRHFELQLRHQPGE